MELDQRDRYPCRSFETGELHLEHRYNLDSELCERCGFKDTMCTGTRLVHPYDDAYTESEPCFYEAEWMGIPSGGGEPQPYCDDCISIRTRIYPISKPDVAAAAPPAWRTPVKNDQGLAAMPPIEDQSGEASAGRIELAITSATAPSIRMSTVSYGEDVEFGDYVERIEQANVELHLPAWKARRLAYQLLDLTDHVDPDGGTDPNEP